MKRLPFLPLLAVSLLAACSNEQETRGVPAGIRPEDATFSYVHRSAPPQDILVVRLSRANFCDRDEVPAGAEFVEIRVPALSSGLAEPGVCAVDGDSCAVVLAESEARCAGSVGSGANSGSVTLDSVTAAEVRGSFHGRNEDGNIDLQGSFVATACLDPSASCL